VDRSQGTEQRGKLDRRERGVEALVAGLRSGPLERLLDGIGGEHAEAHGDVGGGRGRGDPVGGLPGDVVEVRRGAADHRTERDHRIDAAARDHLAHDLRQLPRSRAAHDRHRVGLPTGPHDRIERAGDQRLDDQAVEPARDDREPEPSGDRVPSMVCGMPRRYTPSTANGLRVAS